MFYMFQYILCAVLYCILGHIKYLHTTRLNEVESGVYWLHLVPLSVPVSACGRNCVRSSIFHNTSRIISYLQILLTNLIRRVAYQIVWQITQFDF